MADCFRVLVIDDDETVRRLVATVLQRDGHQVELAVSGTQALSLLDAASFDAVVTDKNLGDFNGLELVVALRAKHPTLPLVLMTGAPEKMTAETMPDAYLAKPFRTLASIGQAIADAIEHQRIAALRRKAQEQLAGLRSALAAAPAGR